LFGDRFKIGRDPAHAAEHGERGRAIDPWLLVIICRSGHIYVHSRDRLGVATNNRGATARALVSLPGVEVLQDGDDGLNAAFPLEAFDQVAAILNPRRRRRLSPEHRQRLVAMGKANLNMVNSAHVGFAGRALIRAQTVQDDQGHVPVAPVALGRIPAGGAFPTIAGAPPAGGEVDVARCSERVETVSGNDAPQRTKLVAEKHLWPKRQEC
jgi:hypothetical protein